MKVIRIAGRPTDSARMRGAAHHRGRRDVSGCQLGSLNGAPPILAGALVEDPNSLAAPGFVDGMRVCPPPLR